MSTEIHVVRNKPIAQFEAMQFNGSNGADIVDWMGHTVQSAGGNDDGNFHADLVGGSIYLEPSDWIIRRSQYVYATTTNKGFEKFYERVSV